MTCELSTSLSKADINSTFRSDISHIHTADAQRTAHQSVSGAWLAIPGLLASEILAHLLSQRVAIAIT